MKTPKPTKQAASAPLDFPSFRPTKTLAQVTQDWIAKQKKNTDGGNDFVSDFLTIATLVCENYKTFTFRDFASMTRGFDTPVEKLAPLFNSWTAELKANNRVDCLNLFGDPQWTFK